MRPHVPVLCVAPQVYGLGTGALTSPPRTWPCGCQAMGGVEAAAAGPQPVAFVVLGAALGGRGEARLLALTAAVDLASAGSRLLAKAAINVPPGAAGRPRLAVDVAKYYAGLLAGRMAPLAGLPQAQPRVLSNASVLSTARSLPALVHPCLPICVRGYRSQRQGIRRPSAALAS